MCFGKHCYKDQKLKQKVKSQTAQLKETLNIFNKTSTSKLLEYVRNNAVNSQ